MSIFDELIQKFSPSKVKPAVLRALSYSATEYEDLLRDQLLHGKGSDGQDLKPGYLEDPYFKTPAAALRYAQWKKKISPNVGRNFNAPNLYITGYYHKRLKVFVFADGLSIDNFAMFGEEVNQKYGGKATVLGGEFREKYIEGSLRPAVLKELNL